MSSLSALSCLHQDEQIFFKLLKKNSLIYDAYTNYKAEVFLLVILTILMVVTVVIWIYA